MKELYIKVHEELIAEYLEQHPTASEQEACDATADAAWSGMSDRYADMIDDARQRRKDGML